MTKKLYDSDSYACEFDAVVISCEKCEKGYEIVLDQTLFFPEEGGQCCDRGEIDGIEITDVQIKNETIYHYASQPFEVSKTVHGKIDFSLRFSNMQNHTGEHIICGIAHRKYGYENVGFHLGADYVTMDLDGPLTKEQIEEIEILANEAVFKNVDVMAEYPDEETLKDMDYRSKSELSGNIRIVTIDGYDVCACCAPHVARTGEVGIIKIVDYTAHRGGMRLTIHCGYDALRDYHERYLHTLAISNLLSVKQHEVTEGVQKLLDDMGKLRHELSEKNKTIAAMYVDNMTDCGENVCIFDSSLDRDAMRIIANGGMKKISGVVAVMSGNDDDGYSYIMGSQNVNLRNWSKEINSALSGRGGGSETMIQGSIGAGRAEIEEFVKNM